jgi:membrane-associated protease RseP (regulator of RpoE activity)
MGIAQQFGLSLLFALMAFAFFNDFNRLFSG